MLELVFVAAIFAVLAVCAFAPFILTKGEADDLR